MLRLWFRPVSRAMLGRCPKLTSTIAKRTSVQEAANEKRFEYYKNLNTQLVDNAAVFPGWDKALPFEAIPGPRPLPIIGNNWRMMPKIGEFYGKSPRDMMDVLHKRYGDLIMLKGLVGMPPMVLIFHPTDIETLYRNEGPWPIHRGFPSMHFYRKVLRKDMYQNIGGVFNTQGEEWYKFRSIINPILIKPKNVMLYVEKMNSVTNQLIDNITYFASTNEKREMPENFLQELYKWSLESIGLVTLDMHLGCLDRNLSQDSETAKFMNHIPEMMDLTYKLDIMPSIWKTISTPTWRRYVEVMDNITNICYRVINEVKDGLGNTQEQNSMLQQLLAKDPKLAVVTAIDMLIAGIDTTARVLGGTLYFLAKHPEKQAALRNEAVKLLPSKNSPITSETLAKADYLKATIKEATRIAPIGIGTQRITVKDMVLGGHKIPKGSFIITNNMITANDHTYFKRADEFLPERWLRSTTGELSFKNVSQFISLPFGFGARSCIGKRIANVELEIALLKIIRNFELNWPHEDMVFGGRLIYGVESPLKFRVSPVH